MSFLHRFDPSKWRTLALAAVLPILSVQAEGIDATPAPAVFRPTIDTPPPYRTSPFVHPGGLHTRTDLDRMKTKVAAGESPWIEGWTALLSDPMSRTDYRHHPRPNLGSSRQAASRDAHAAYLNFLRGYISGDERHTDHAIRICNDWAAAVNQVPTGNDIPGLAGIPIAEFALVGELLRTSPRWKPEDFRRFQEMMIRYWYPVCNDFLENHNGAPLSHYWANWDICNIGALLAIGVLCDRPDIYDEGVAYFLRGGGTGSIMNAVYTIHPDGLGQWQESGRDQPHARLGVGLLAQACQIAWNQGLDLFGVADNRLLAGAEYVARTTLNHEVPFTFYTNSQPANHFWLSNHTRTRLGRPVWELLYNHYVVRRGLEAPHTAALAHLSRPEQGGGDHFGYGTLTFTLSADASPWPPFPVPPAPTELRAAAGVGHVELTWTAPSGDTVRGYEIHRALSAEGPWKILASTVANTAATYVDTSVEEGRRYYYAVVAVNQSGAGPRSNSDGATPLAAGPVPEPWRLETVGRTSENGSAAYSPASGHTLILSGGGRRIGGSSDACTWVGRTVNGDFILTARLTDVRWAGRRPRVGLMMRETLLPDSPTAFLTLGDVGTRMTRFGVRSETGASVREASGNAYTWLPVFFRLQRTGATVSAFHSSDGETWFPVGSEASWDLPDSVRIGFAVSSDEDGGRTTATFDNIRLTHRPATDR